MTCGRNDPCPCGSGRKYKKCHLEADQASRRPQRAEPVPSPLHALDRRLVEKILSFAEMELGVDLEDFFDECFEPDMATQLAMPWLAYTEPFRGKTMAEHFLDRRRAELSQREIDWIEAMMRSWITVWEVAAVDPGYGMSLIDLLTGERREVSESSASRLVEVHDGLLGRVVDCMGQSLLAGAHPTALPPRDTAAVVDGFRRRFKIRRKFVPPDRLRDIEAAAALLALWQAVEDELTNRSLTLPVLENTDGDPILLTTDRYRFDTARREEVLRRLEAVPLVRGDTIIAHVDVDDDHLHVETNSLARADAVKRDIETALAGIARWESRSHTDPRSEAFRDEHLPPLPDASPEEAAVIREMKERHYASWLDKSLPLLGGRTPREAVKSRGGKQQVMLALKEIAQVEARLPEAERLDVRMLYDALGIRMP